MKTSTKLVIAILFVLFLICVSSLSYHEFIWQPEVSWDESPDKIIIWSDPGCMHLDVNYIPTVQIWGNGHVVWVKKNIRRDRTVWEGYLTQSELKQLINRLIDIDFFRFWFEDYQYCTGNFLTVELSGITSRNYVDPQNSQFTEFYYYITTGAGAAGEEFIPTQGSLDATPVEDAGLPANTEANYVWPDQKFGYSLEEVYARDSEWIITGEEILFAWQIVNSPKPVVESDGRVFWIGIHIPGISK